MVKCNKPQKKKKNHLVILHCLYDLLEFPLSGLLRKIRPGDSQDLEVILYRDASFNGDNTLSLDMMDLFGLSLSFCHTHDAVHNCLLCFYMS